MPKFNCEQGTEEWHEWRSDKITASDVAKILGVSPWGTPYELWKEKMGISEGQEFSSNARYGQMMEGKIREYAEKELGIGFLPACYSHPDYPYIGASLDGIDMEEKIILEVKACNREVFEAAKDGSIPLHYQIQMDVQLMCVPNANENYIYFYHNMSKMNEIQKRDIVAIRVERKPSYDDIVKAIDGFMKHIETETAPPLTSDDFYEDDTDEFHEAEKAWIEANKELSEAKKKETEAKTYLTSLCYNKNVKGRLVKMGKVYRKGTVDYAGLCRDKGINEMDLEVYRKEGIEYYKPTILK